MIFPEDAVGSLSPGVADSLQDGHAGAESQFKVQADTGDCLPNGMGQKWYLRTFRARSEKALELRPVSLIIHCWEPQNPAAMLGETHTTWK